MDVKKPTPAQTHTASKDVAPPKLQAPQSTRVGKANVVKDAAPVDSVDKGSFLEGGILAALKQAQAQGKLQEMRTVASGNLKGVMDTLLDALEPKKGVPRNYWVGDIEGREDNQLQTLIDNGVITFDEHGKAQFADQNSRVVFLGDIGDRGPWSIRARKVLTELKRQDPKGVDSLWGNRCIGKLGLLNDLPALKSLKDEGYKAWLTEKAGDGATPAQVRELNTTAHQVQFWLQEHAAREQLMHHETELNQVETEDGLEHYRSALAEQRGVPASKISLEEAAQNYLDSLKPGGEYFEFLKMGNWGADLRGNGMSNALAWHGGTSSTSIKQVPLDDRLPADAKDYARRWQDMGNRLFEQVEESIKKTGRVPTELLSLGDSDWDAKAGRNSFKAWSNTYGERDKEDGNYRGVSKEVAEFYQKAGYFFEHVGHSPIGSLPLPLKSDDNAGVTRIYHDTSFSTDGSKAMVASIGDMVVMVGRLGDEKNGELVMWSVKPGEKSPIGMVTDDGFTVRGVTLDGKYSLSRYANGYEIQSKKVTPEELGKLNPKAVALEMSEEGTTDRDAWFKDLEKFDHTVHTPHTLESKVGGRTPIVISGASEYGSLPLDPQQMDKMWRSLFDAFGPDDVAFFTGGTNVEKTYKDEKVKAPEFIFHDLLKEKRAAGMDHTAVGFIPEQTNTSDIDPTLELFVTGKKSVWDAPLRTAMAISGDKKGAAVFIGGGSTITKAIEEAKQNPHLHVFLVASADIVARAKRPPSADETVFGASDRAALELLRSGKVPANFHIVKPDDNLGAMMKKAVG